MPVWGRDVGAGIIILEAWRDACLGVRPSHVLLSEVADSDARREWAVFRRKAKAASR
jgi:hypothetical protein